MEPYDDDREVSSRRTFLQSTGGLLTTVWLGTEWAAVTAAAHHAEDLSGAAAPVSFEYLSAAEAADVDAIAAQIIPSGATPGAREAHAVHFIDRALSTFFAAWSQEFRAGLHEFQAKFHAVRPAAATFATAPTEEQLAFLSSVERTPFFGDIRMLTVIGMLSSPKYGGNFQGEGWKALGFVDQHAFAPPFGYYDAKYTGFVPYSAKG